MSKLANCLLAFSIGLLSACSDQTPSTPAAEPSPATAGPRGAMIMNNVIVILNSGSTNTIGYRILVAANGEASFVSGDGPGQASLPADLYGRLKADVDRAAPLSQIATANDCMKPTSFSTSTSIALGGEHSPDLSCSADPKAQKLLGDITDIVAFLAIRNTPRSEGKELPPQNL